MANWNPWHGCHKHSPGCAHCYVFRGDARYDKKADIVHKNSAFDLPLKRNRKGQHKIPPGEMVYTCFTSDFLLPDADEWRKEAWQMMKYRSDLHFFFITKRIERLHDSLPEDWGAGYPNVSIGCTVENQDRADYRLPIFLAAPIQERFIICEPLLTPMDLSAYLQRGAVRAVVAGGESGDLARLCDYAWILALRDQCRAAGVSFTFKQTGAHFQKDGRRYQIPRKQQHAQARKAGLTFVCE